MITNGVLDNTPFVIPLYPLIQGMLIYSFSRFLIMEWWIMYRYRESILILIIKRLGWFQSTLGFDLLCCVLEYYYFPCIFYYMYLNNDIAYLPLCYLLPMLKYNFHLYHLPWDVTYFSLQSRNRCYIHCTPINYYLVSNV